MEHRIPGFSAEMSLYDSSNDYYNAKRTSLIHAIQPALMIGSGGLNAKCTSTDGGSSCNCPKGICKAGKDYCECHSTAFADTLFY